jgi:hypothetical protein
MGLKIMTNSKNQPMKTIKLCKVVEMKRIDNSFVPVGFSRIGTERLIKLEWEM